MSDTGDLNKLAGLLAPPDMPFSFTRGVVSAVNTTTHTATVTADGGAFDAPYYTDRTAPAVNDHVDIMFFGVSPRIIGVLP